DAGEQRRVVEHPQRGLTEGSARKPLREDYVLPVLEDEIVRFETPDGDAGDAGTERDGQRRGAGVRARVHREQVGGQPRDLGGELFERELAGDPDPAGRGMAGDSLTELDDTRMAVGPEITEDDQLRV